MQEYNSPFFNAIATLFLIYREKHGEGEALEFMRGFFSRRLGPVYDSFGFRKGSPQDFERVVKRNDELLGLRVSFEVSENKIIYRFHTDPFPGLKGHVDGRRFDDTYMLFKILHLLGEKWSYSTPRHLWDWDEYTEHVIVK